MNTTTDYTTAQELAHIQTEAYERRGLSSRPYGRQYLALVTELENEIINAELHKSITHEVLSILEDWNCHTVAEAAHRVMMALFAYAPDDEEPDEDPALEQAKERAAEKLNKYGYDGERFAAQIVRVSGWFGGQPSRVVMADGSEIFL